MREVCNVVGRAKREARARAWKWRARFALPALRMNPASLGDDLHLVARLERIARVQPVDDEETVQRAIHNRHARREALRRIAGRYRHDVQPQRPRRRYLA